MPLSLTAENILLVGSILLFLSILAGKTSYRFGVPTLVFFLLVGMLAGSEGIGGIQFDDPKKAQFVGIIAFNFILFSGGMETDWKAIKPILWQGITLSTLGVLMTAMGLGAFVYYVTDFTLYESLLLGSIVSSTDAAAVFSILRSRSLALKHNLRPTLELESGSNDPMANVLTIVFTTLVLNEDEGIASIVPFLLKQLLIGGALGLLAGHLSKFVINRIRLDFEGLSPVLVMALMFFTYSATDALGGNGFLAVYLCAVYLGNQELIHKKGIIKAFDGYAWLSQIILFLTLGLLVFPSQIVPVIGIGLVISLFLMFVVRPLTVFFSLSLFNMKNRSRWFVSWVGLRGAVPIVFATYPLVAGLERANMIFNIVFFVSLSSVMIQGTTLSFVAKILGVGLPESLKPRTDVDLELADSVKSELVEIVLEDGAAVGRSIVQLGFPRTALISMIQRDGQYITPNGTTVLEKGDRMFILAEDNEALAAALKALDFKLESEQA